MKLLSKLLILAMAVFAMSCGNDNPTTPNNGGGNNGGNNNGGNNGGNGGGNGGNNGSTTENLFDFANFATLEFKEFTLESDGSLNPTFSGTLKFDETKSIAQLNGATGYEIDKIYNKSGITPDDEDFVYVSLNNGKQFYVNEEIINSIVEIMSPKGIDLPFKLPDNTYYKLVDLDAPANETKVIAEFPYNDDDLNQYVSVNGKLIIGITNAGTEKFSYKGQAINTHKAVVTVTFDGTYTLKSQNGVTTPTPTKISLDINFLVHHKMGIVKQWVPSTTIKLAAGLEMPIKGYQFQIK